MHSYLDREFSCTLRPEHIANPTKRNVVISNLCSNTDCGCYISQFPVECSLPWMLVEHIMDSSDIGLLESILLPFDIYNDAADQALRVLKQRFLYDEIEAEVNAVPTYECCFKIIFSVSNFVLCFIHFASFGIFVYFKNIIKIQLSLQSLSEVASNFSRSLPLSHSVLHKSCFS